MGGWGITLKIAQIKCRERQDYVVYPVRWEEGELVY